MSVICSSCNTQVEAGAVFCDNCGFDLLGAPQAPVQAPQASWTPPAGGGVNCPSCGHPNIPGSAFCEDCGSPMGQAPPAGQAGADQGGYQETVLAPQPPEPPEQYQQPVQPQGPVLQPPEQVEPPPPVMAPSYVAGRLVIQASNTSLPIHPGVQEVMIGREDPVSGIFPEIDLDPYGGHEAGVGRQHAKLSVQGGQVHLEDLNSVNGTFLNRRKLVSGQPMPVNNGDELRFGKLVFNYYTH